MLLANSQPLIFLCFFSFLHLPQRSRARINLTAESEATLPAALFEFIICRQPSALARIRRRSWHSGHACRTNRRQTRALCMLCPSGAVMQPATVTSRPILTAVGCDAGLETYDTRVTSKVRSLFEG